jgi:23S rRNA (guanosine2251-2'-O)-methyltransferase
MIVYGRNPVREALRGPRPVTRVWATKNAAREPWLAAAPVEHASAEQIEQRCGSPAHQGICADAGPFIYARPEALLARENPLIVALDRIQDPQNLGSICRTAECAGASGVVVPERGAATVTPAVCKASAGAVEHLPVARVRNMSDFLADAKVAGLWCYGAQVGAPAAYDTVDYARAVVLVLGSEGHGLRRRVASSCDLLVSLPQRGRVGSLGVAAAAAVLIYEAASGRA